MASDRPSATAGSRASSGRIGRVARFALVVACIGLVMLGGWYGAYRRLDVVREGLVVRANAFPPSSLRPSHREPVVPGAMVDRFESVYPLIADAAATWPDAEIEPTFLQCAYVRDGMWPVDDLPFACADLVEEHRDVVQAVLEAPRSETLGDPLRLRGMKWWPLATITTMAAIGARIDLEQHGDAASALHTCIDLLALHRDLVALASLEERTAAATIVARSWTLCGDALAAASPTERHAAARALAAIAQGLPPLSASVRVEALEGELALFGHELDERGRASLPSWAHQVIARADRLDVDPNRGRTPVVIAPFVLPSPWIAYTNTMVGIASDIDGAPASATAAIRERLDDPELPDLARAAAATMWTRHIAADHVARARVELLRAAANALVLQHDTGVWPRVLEASTLAPGAELAVEPGKHGVTVFVRYGADQPADTITLAVD